MTEQLYLGIHRRPLPRAGHPRPPDLNPPVVESGIPEPRAPDDRARRPFDGHEGKHVPSCLSVTCSFDVGGEIVASADGLRDPPRDLSNWARLGQSADAVAGLDAADERPEAGGVAVRGGKRKTAARQGTGGRSAAQGKQHRGGTKLRKHRCSDEARTPAPSVH
ncbi:MAG: hypothetical protein AAGI52_13305 [Bacteroidota bacterium]